MQYSDGTERTKNSRSTRTRRLANGFGVAATTLLLYDHILTLPAEMSCIWKRKLSAGTLIFFINRYGTLLYRLLLTTVQVFSFANTTEAEADLVCHPYCVVMYVSILNHPF